MNWKGLQCYPDICQEGVRNPKNKWKLTQDLKPGSAKYETTYSGVHFHKLLIFIQGYGL
jgi:hypothetical protein